mgnify:CR=1 FL=1
MLDAEASLQQEALGIIGVNLLYGAFFLHHEPEKLMESLQRIEDTLGRSMARSDEQLAYYVAQAREVIDLSLASQKQIVDDLQRMAGRRAAMGSET